MQPETPNHALQRTAPAVAELGVVGGLYARYLETNDPHEPKEL
jgi:hypothetical protein